jgi:purine-binding chemotaxis protein CheW
MPEITQVCTFFVDGLYFGIDVNTVQEVMHPLEKTSVPLASTSVVGLINLRGQIVTAIDLRRRLGLAERPEGAEVMYVVIRTDDGALSLVVDEIGDIIEVDAATYEQIPDTLQGAARELIGGVHKLDERLLLILEPHKTAATELALSLAH